MIPSPLMGEDQDEGENLGCRSKLDALRQRLRKVEEPPHLNPLPPGERKEKGKDLSHQGRGKKGKWEKARIRMKIQDSTCHGMSLH